MKIIKPITNYALWKLQYRLLTKNLHSALDFYSYKSEV